MHTLSRRYREGSQTDDRTALGRAAAAGIDAGHDRRFDLWAWPGRDEPGQAGAETFPRGFGVTYHLVIPAKAGTQEGRPRFLGSLGPRLHGGDGIGDVQ